MNPLRRIPLFKRFPSLRIVRREDDLVKPERRQNYPAFANDFATLDQELMPFFHDFDDEALRSQNAYRWMYVILILGGTLATVLGIVQLAYIDTPWPGIIGSILALVLGVVTSISSRFNHQKRYLTARLAAERLRAEYFLFLGRFDHYNDDQDRVRQLRKRIADISKSKERQYESA